MIIKSSNKLCRGLMTSVASVTDVWWKKDICNLINNLIIL